MACQQQLLDALNTAFSQKYHSLAQYILDAKPYVAAGMDRALAAVGEVAAEDRCFADRLADAIEQLEGVPQLDIYNPDVASLNYLALDYLVQVLLKELRAQLPEYERFAVLANGAGPAHQALTALAEATRKQIARLQATTPAA